MRLIAALSAGLVAVATVAVPTAPAEAQHHRGGWRGGGGYDHGGGYGREHGPRGGYGYRGGGYAYRGNYYGRPYGGYRGYYGYHGGSRIVCNRFWYHGRLVRSCHRARF